MLNLMGKISNLLLVESNLALTKANLDIAVEEAANLKGWSRRLADDWVKEGRKQIRNSIFSEDNRFLNQKFYNLI